MATGCTFGNKHVLLALLVLAACAPASDPDPRCRWPGFRCAMGGPPQTIVATVDNPFLCPRAPAPGQPPGASR